MSKIGEQFIGLFGLEMSKGSKGAQEEEVVALLDESIRAAVFNITAIACLMSLLQEHKKVVPSDLELVMKYIHSKCHPAPVVGGEQRGGSMASDYFGYPHPAYTTDNLYSGTTMSQIDFAANMARPSIPLSGAMMPGFGTGMIGGSGKNLRHLATHSREAARVVRQVTKLHNTRISKTGLGMLLNIIDIHLNCFAEDLVAVGPLTTKKVQKVVSLKRNLMMQ